MNHSFAPIVSRGFVSLALVFAFLVYAPAIRADGVDLVSQDATDVLAVEGAPPEKLPDVMPQLAPEPPNLRLRNTLIIGGTAALFTAYGMAKWWETGFGGGFDKVNEGWFGSDTQYGGADKLGHMFTNYASMRLLIPLFEAVGNSREASVKLSAWTTLGIFTGIEIADGYSRAYKFSWQDAAMNVAGVALGVVLETYPQLDDVFDFRFAYSPSPGNQFDPFGDYSGQKYLLVVKADGFEPLRRNRFLRYLEVAVGYGAKGFDPGGERRRDIYLGLSLNLSRLLADTAYEGRMHSTPFQRGTERVFELIQFPTIGYKSRQLD
jgi:hypothetical protein